MVSRVLFFLFFAIPGFEAFGAPRSFLPTPLWECNGVLIRQQGPASVKAEGSVTFLIKVQNVGVCLISGASLTDYFPLRTVYKNALPLPASQAGVAPPIPVDKVEWLNLEIFPEYPAQEFVVTVEVQTPGERILTNTVCLEHPSTGRICDVLDVYVKP